MPSRGLYNKLLELRENRNLAQYYWSAVHKCSGIVESISSDTVTISRINHLGEEDGKITFPTGQITHIIEDSQEIREIKQLLIQKSFKL
jgi:hypothetical protein